MLSIPQQQVLTKDNVSITLDAVVFFSIVDLQKVPPLPNSCLCQRPRVCRSTQASVTTDNPNPTP